MVQVCIAAVALTVLTAMSLHANRRFSKESRLPMQWSLSGSVNWSAPRPLALAFTPALAGGVIIAATIATFTTRPRPGQEGFEIPVLLALALTFIAVHALHLWLIDRTMKMRGR